MKLAEFYRKLERNDPSGLRGVKARFAIIASLMVLAGVTTPFLKLEFILPPVLFVVSVEFVANLIFTFWIATGRGVQYRIYLATVVDLLLVTVAIHYIGGIETPLSWVYAVVLLAYASLYGMRVGIFAAAVSSLLYSSLLLAEFANVVPHIDFGIVNSSYLRDDRFYLNIKLVSENVLFFITATVSGLLSERAIRSKNELEQRNAEILKMQKSLETHMGDLERTVAERTQELTGANEQLRREVAERTHVEDALRESEECYRMLVEEARDIICTIDMKTGIITSVNSFAAKTLGYKPEDVLNKFSFLEMVHPEDHEKVVGRLQELASEKKRIPNFPLRLRKADGAYMNVEVNGTVTYDTEDKPETFIGVIRDVTERHRAEEALRESEERYRTLADNSLTGTCLIQDGKYQFVNRRLAEMSGYSRAELEGMSFNRLVHPDDLELAQKAIAKRISRQDLTGHYQFRAVTKNGDILWIETLGTPVDYQGRPAVLVNLIDITERRQAEQQLRASEEKYRTLLDSIDIGFYETDLAGNFLFFNETIRKDLGYSKEELVGMNYRQYTDGENANILYRAFNTVYRTGQVDKAFECTIRSKDGKEVPVEFSVSLIRDDSGKPVGFRGLTRDVTERKRLERQFFQAQKMESIGTLAGGIAHDFNNLLGGILGYASFMKSRIAADHPFFRYIDTIERTAMRAGELTSQLLGFARGGKYEIKSIDLNDIVEETLRIIDRTFDRLIEIKTHLCPSLPSVEGDAGQIQQALMNLCVNARDAMADGGRLIIETDVETLSEEYVRTHMGAKEGSYVSLSVTDTGTGMDRQTMQRIFEPFFTTKEQGKGTGLGLSMVYGVVKNHGGHVRVYSEPGEGTTFKIYLPCSRVAGAKESPEIETSSDGNELILVADDEESIRSLARETLEAHGYRVLLAEDGAKAVEMYAEHDGDIGLVILDMIMPKMGGRETFLKLKELNPNVKALLSTGYSQNGKAQEILDSGVMGFVQKPYQVNALLSRVRRALDARVKSKTPSAQRRHPD